MPLLRVENTDISEEVIYTSFEELVETVEKKVCEPSEKLIEKATNEGCRGIDRIYQFLERIMDKMEIQFQRFEKWLDRVLAKIEGP